MFRNCIQKFLNVKTHFNKILGYKQKPAETGNSLKAQIPGMLRKNTVLPNEMSQLFGSIQKIQSPNLELGDFLIIGHKAADPCLRLRCWLTEPRVQRFSTNHLCRMRTYVNRRLAPLSPGKESLIKQSFLILIMRKGDGTWKIHL